MKGMLFYETASFRRCDPIISGTTFLCGSRRREREKGERERTRARARDDAFLGLETSLSSI